MAKIDLLVFVLVAIIGTLALAGVSFTNWRWWWRSATGFAATAIIAVMLVPSTPAALGPEISWADTSPFRELILFALMLLGMVARVLSVAIEHRKGLDETKRGVVTVDRWDFVYPMLLAIPTFAALLSQTRTETLTVANIALAFQTGFFWQTILKKGESQ
jgi:hypothetical protein